STEKKSLVQSVDDMLADIEGCINQISTNELYQDTPLPPLPMTPPISPYPPYTSFSTTTTNNSSYIGPTTNTFGEISNLPDSFGGFLNKVSYNFLNKKSTKKLYLVLANLTLYLFNSNEDDFKSFEDSLPINKFSHCVESKRGGPNTIYFKTIIQKNNPITVSNEFGNEDIVLNNDVKKTLELECKDKEEMIVWLELINENIIDAKNGKRAANSIMDESLEVGNDKRESDKSYFSNANKSSRKSAASNFSNNSTEESNRLTSNTLGSLSSFDSSSIKLQLGSSSNKETNMFAQNRELDKKEKKEEKKRLKEEKRKKEIKEQMDFVKEEFM
ncbi:hypothetical protein HK099_000140, partial [Clydaea vesicula]